ncbi:MAG: tRNA (5-methylaminomethyl-2-thiouridine)(34)-methyltransferase MnmD [Bacteroidales bacterium]|nr:tRNA (5-methylaminomethyl-2-thiouridine)(34)-methyltransferase MnmD [Bacteroidales bacterium]
MQKYKRIPQITADGSVTLYIKEIDEHYHSTNGAIVEADIVYMKNALLERGLKDVNILEVGFGTGLNCFMTFLESVKNEMNIHYTTLELYPLSVDEISSINYSDILSPEHKAIFLKMHDSKWNEPVEITPNFIIEKRNIDLTKDEVTGKFDVVYFDSFAPDKQPEMWSDDIYKKIVNAMNSNAVMTTYCAKGIVRRGWQNAGLTMERIPGPPGKREMLRGKKIEK